MQIMNIEEHKRPQADVSENKYVDGQAYAVQWIDSCGTPAGWISLEDKDYPAEVQNIVSYGTLINHTAESIVLAQSYIAGTETIQKQAMGIVVIPVACILRIEPVNASFRRSSCQALASELKPQVSL